MSNSPSWVFSLRTSNRWQPQRQLKEALGLAVSAHRSEAHRVLWRSAVSWSEVWEDTPLWKTVWISSHPSKCSLAWSVAAFVPRVCFVIGDTDCGTTCPPWVGKSMCPKWGLVVYVPSGRGDASATLWRSTWWEAGRRAGKPPPEGAPTRSTSTWACARSAYWSALDFSQYPRTLQHYLVHVQCRQCLTESFFGKLQSQEPWVCCLVTPVGPMSSIFKHWMNRIKVEFVKWRIVF